MKEAYYFSHDSNAKTDEKVLDLRDTFGWEGYGIYWALIETLRDTTDYRFPLKSLSGLAKNLGVKQEKISKIILGFNLFSHDENFFWSESLIKRMDAKDKKSKKLAESARKRWANKDANAMQMHEVVTANAMQMHEVVTANAMQMQCTPLAGKEKKGKESKGKEKKEEVEIFFPFESDGFKKFWQIWKDYKKDQHKETYKSSASEQASLEKLNNISGGIEEVAIEIIKESMSNTWKGLFELKNGTQKKQSTVNFGSEIDQLIASKYGN